MDPMYLPNYAAATPYPTYQYLTAPLDPMAFDSLSSYSMPFDSTLFDLEAPFDQRYFQSLPLGPTRTIPSRTAYNPGAPYPPRTRKSTHSDEPPRKRCRRGEPSGSHSTCVGYDELSTGEPIENIPPPTKRTRRVLEAVPPSTEDHQEQDRVSSGCRPSKKHTERKARKSSEKLNVFAKYNLTPPSFHLRLSPWTADSALEDEENGGDSQASRPTVSEEVDSVSLAVAGSGTVDGLDCGTSASYSISGPSTDSLTLSDLDSMVGSFAYDFNEDVESPLPNYDPADVFDDMLAFLRQWE
ncbi:hypothetical protein D9613_002637 [Agrocybe pediades]|uniref:Uncharacterized protein n=1 Tax=Agrocybe pediades TaxID=84607 RepID=A0A8H4VMC9_9AGAR|nr:hypothetical protein D9613_002637 [Agrocybe pediades]